MQTMTPTQIVTAYTQKRGTDPRKILRAMKKDVHDGTGLVLHTNNSVLFVHHIGNQDAELHLFSEDSPLQLMQSLKEFIKHIRDSHLRAVYGRADNEGIVRFLKKAGVDVQPSDKSTYNWMALV